MTSHLLRALSLAAILTMTACSILPRSEPLTVYRLPAPAAPGMPTAAAATFPALRIGTPYAARTLDSERILVVPEADTIKSYSGARWSDPAPVMLRNRLLEAFTSDGRFSSLSSDNANIAADVELTGDLVSFQTEYVQGVPTILVQFDARLIDSPSRRQIAARRFSIRQPAAGAKVPEVINAFGLATNALSAQVVDWAAAVAGPAAIKH